MQKSPNLNYLINQHEIRIVINNGSRFGNQGAAFNLMNRLVKFGYTGKFHIVYDASCNSTDDSIGKKIEHFVPTYRENGDKVQIFSNGTIEKIENSNQSSLHYIPIAMTAANDCSHVGLEDLCNIYNCSSFISLKPLYWDQGVNKVEFLDGTFEMMDSNLRLVNQDDEEIKLEDVDNKKEKIFLELVLSTKKSGLNFQSIYGLQTHSYGGGSEYLTPTVEIERLVLAAEKLQRSTDPCVILFIHENEQRVDNYFKDENISHIEKINTLDKAIEKLKNPNFMKDSTGKVILINTGNLTAAAFAIIQNESTLPPVVEGANSSEVLERKCYLHAGTSPNGHSTIRYLDQLELGIREDAVLYENACSALDLNNGKIEPLIDFMKKYLAGEMKHYFDKRRGWFFSKKNMLEVSVEILESAIKADHLPNPVQGETVLMWAAKKNLPQVVKRLIESGLDPQQKDSQGSTAYNYAVDHGNSLIEEMLKQYNEDLTNTDNKKKRKF